MPEQRTTTAGPAGRTAVGPAEARLILDAVDARPVAGTRSIGELVRHIVCAEARYLRGAATTEFPDWAPEVEALASPQAIGDWYTRRFTEGLALLAALDGEAPLRPVDYRGLVRMPALGFAQLAALHTVDHRGQLSVGLRGVGARLPPIHGLTEHAREG